MFMILIALGANLPLTDDGSPYDTCFHAVEEMQKIETIHLVAVSSWYRTRPVPPDPTQPDFCNGVVRFSGAPDPVALLEALHEIEARFGRVRSVPNAARTLDLDLIDVNGMVRETGSPILPHPRAHLRTFVLRPLLDVAPDWVHPLLLRPARELFSALPERAEGEIRLW
ncbi:MULTISPECIES: 2-amino-4-hydroxy-6-hydroxymethyldihydropteridine diphosphokinase [Acidiphilium]|uniref:2-amino-4-hydroxy-6-hydroxymethyldihydropteridine pyrophosphokinase n=2 Tax=Acidiphilium TaxID=522 RepID=F0J3U4_ACIMA|nr:2-amino-4-hydroxy-6-hydroxymethyldihydropteridine diphosphokinase [Acidiphilium multivorum]BAJ79950.1 2-amino-4-hydroxy-6-hydroxymethyldihydropteridine pyrophosphokinase [Acidiphilium multivorum AIU301]GAN74211.1 2-amino-4-hydroxy-6-hydroxymethyldihydropteridine pyrophosphokinase [Acidiphilium multivorum AIU301]